MSWQMLIRYLTSKPENGLVCLHLTLTRAAKSRYQMEGSCTLAWTHALVVCQLDNWRDRNS